MWRVIADYHTHTKYSHGIGAGTVFDNAREGQKQGLKIVGIAEHGPANWGHLATNRLADFDAVIREAKAAEEALPGLQVLAGTEANVVSFTGDLDVPRALQKKLDQVLAGFHTTVVPQNWEDGVNFLAHRIMSGFSLRLKKVARNENTKTMVEAVYKNDINIITHPGLHIDIDTSELARACVKRDTALEINVKHGIKSVAFIKAAAREGVKFAIGSDAHQPKGVGHLEEGVKSAKLAGLRADQIINVREE